MGRSATGKKKLMDKSVCIKTEHCVWGALSVCLSICPSIHPSAAATTHQEMEIAASNFGSSFRIIIRHGMSHIIKNQPNNILTLKMRAIHCLKISATKLPLIQHHFSEERIPKT